MQCCQLNLSAKAERLRTLCHHAPDPHQSGASFFMNYDIEKIKELQSINERLRELNWQMFVALIFVVPASCFVIWAGLNALALLNQIEKLLK